MGLGPDCDVWKGNGYIGSTEVFSRGPSGKKKRERENAGSDEWVESLPSPNEEAER